LLVALAKMEELGAKHSADVKTQTRPPPNNQKAQHESKT